VGTGSLGMEAPQCGARTESSESLGPLAAKSQKSDIYTRDGNGSSFMTHGHYIISSYAWD